ncbi:hypothetical protein BDF20DRAFT_816793 [Mycotypha africana]|uniref:uncharacterized protein n=1 Tax=Mycotypha africana TaxID=64632 RepID=UPI0023005CDD|nr:uncharacterized protein BDF20DRAFT_816793 [Mycotypha africana]KAI8984527.1 hypothetical protein BDF20DRAFT_816793 [Mycotypha africana]
MDKRQLEQEKQNKSFMDTVKAELFSPEKRQGNLNIALSVTVFTGAIVFLRNWGELLAV